MFVSMIHDRMTECVYPCKLTSFQSATVPEPVSFVPVIERGREAFEEINLKMGLSFDEQDIEYYTSLFRDDIRRSPTTVELFDIVQSNSGHNRLWLFNGKLIIDGQPMYNTLILIVNSTLRANLNNSVNGFKEKSSAIMGFPVDFLCPLMPGSASPLSQSKCDLDILFTAETQFPMCCGSLPRA